LSNIGSVPIAIASLDQKQLLVEDYDAPTIPGGPDGTVVMGIPQQYSTDSSSPTN
jgi:hypothetical protein